MANRVITGDIAAINAAKVRKVAPMVQAVEPIKGDWNQNNNWAFNLDRSAGWPLVNAPTIVSVGQNLTFRGPPRVRGILLTRSDVYLQPFVSYPEILIQARITYGSGGYSQQIILDWGAGTIVNLPASTFSVEAVVTGDNNIAGNPVLGSTLGVAFSNELIPKNGYTTITRLYTDVANDLVVIPPYAVGMMIGNLDVPTTSPVNVEIFSSQFLTPILDLADIFGVNLSATWWLPTQSSYLDFSDTGSVYITWILNV